jgi:hypothetical protein
MRLVVSHLNCGATTSGDTTVAFMPRDSKIPPRKAPGFLLIRGLHDVPVRWTSDNSVEIILPKEKELKEEDIQRRQQNTYGIATDYR